MSKILGPNLSLSENVPRERMYNVSPRRLLSALGAAAIATTFLVIASSMGPETPFPSNDRTGEQVSVVPDVSSTTETILPSSELTIVRRGANEVK